MTQEQSRTSMYGFCSNTHCHNREFIGEIKPATIKVKMGSIMADCCLALCFSCIDCVPVGEIPIQKFKNEYKTIIDAIEGVKLARASHCISCAAHAGGTRNYIITIRKASRTDFIEKAKYQDRENVTVQLCTGCALKNRIF